MKEPLRVLIVISNLGFGGAERQVMELAKHVDLTRCELHVCVLSDHIPLAEDWPDRHNRLHIIQKRFKFDVSIPFRLAKLLKWLEVDVVHGFLFDAEIASRLAGFIARTPVIVGSERNSDHYYKTIHRIFYKITNRLMCHCVANSTAGAKFNQGMFQLPDNIYSVVHNGVDIKRFCKRDVTKLRQELGISEDFKVVGMFGSFKRQKNHPLLFDAASKLLKTTSNVKFLIVGTVIQEGSEPTNEYKAKVHKQVLELGLQEHCIFLGARKDVENIYNLCDITVLPSLFEGTPNVALESMASNVPVIATDVADNRKVIPDGKVGYIVPLGDSDMLADRIEQLLSNQKLRGGFALAARSWVEENYSLEKMCEKMTEVYEAQYRLKMS